MQQATSNRQPLKIFTIGHGGLKIEEFLQRLQRHGIVALADVRRFPASKRHPHFARAKLAAALNEKGIIYYWLGETLGGYRTGGYEAYVKTNTFQLGCNELAQLAQKQRLAFMCAELDYRGCHRRFIATYLLSQGIEVWHIDKNGNLLNHASAASIETMQIPFNPME
ncbi:MAG: DUF488 domain-containing protein [candidate division KSB1 bacterium]|nr:DUF488 domain-containing protein [candidate division KSB1 bacterium]